MSETTKTRTGSTRVPSLVAVWLLACLLLSSGLVAVPASPATGAAHATAHRWAGYPIPSTGRAAGGWIGGYRVGHAKVFVITPGRRPNRAGFRAAKPTRDLNGRRGPSRSRTARAAWILSKYGGYRDDTQAAAVDAAVTHLLTGGRWELGGRRGARRVRASGDPATVRRYVRLMLRQSRASAGRYRAVVTTGSADVGGVTSVTVRVTDGRGGPVTGLPVSVTSPDGGTSTPAAGPVTAVTGDDGRAVVRLAAPLAGWRTVTARVGQVPEHRLVVRGPRRKGQAAAAEGGVRRTIVASAAAAVRGAQSVELTPLPGSLVLGGQASVVAAVRGDGSPRDARAELHGPFASASSATCSGAPVATSGATLPGDGTHTLPPVTPSAGGYYAWHVDVDGTPTSMPAAACGAVVKVRGQATVSVSAPVSAGRFDVVSARVSVADLPFGGPVDVTTSIFGPYATAGDACTGNHRDVTQRRPGNGSFTSLSFQLDEPGWYAWRSSLPEGDLWLGVTSACGTTGTLTQVQ